MTFQRNNPECLKFLKYILQNVGVLKSHTTERLKKIPIKINCELISREWDFTMTLCDQEHWMSVSLWLPKHSKRFPAWDSLPHHPCLGLGALRTYCRLLPHMAHCCCWGTCNVYATAVPQGFATFSLLHYIDVVRLRMLSCPEPVSQDWGPELGIFPQQSHGHMPGHDFYAHHQLYFLSFPILVSLTISLNPRNWLSRSQKYYGLHRNGETVPIHGLKGCG